MPNFGEFMGDRVPTDVRGFRPPVDAGAFPFGGQLPPRSSETGLSLNLVSYYYLLTCNFKCCSCCELRRFMYSKSGILVNLLPFN